MKKLGKAVSAGLILLIVVLAVVWWRNGKREEPVSRALIAKAVALTLAGKEEVNKEDRISRFPKGDEGGWFIKYMDYLYDYGCISEELTPASVSVATGSLTYEELDYMLASLGVEYPADIAQVDKKGTDAVTKEIWWQCYEGILNAYGMDRIKEQNIRIFATVSNAADIAPWTAKAVEGTFGFEGLAMDPYIDKTISVLVCDKEIIRLKEVVSEEAFYPNVWITESKEGKLTAFMDGLYRTFSMRGLKENYGGTLGDLQVSSGSILKINLKKDSIRGKVLEVRDESIEIEGYGEVPIGEDFKVYKTYGEPGMQNRSDILVGYELQQFVVADGKICAALTTQAAETTTIRVLIRNSGYESIFHDKISLTADVPFTLHYGDNGKETYPAETVIDIDTASPYVSQGRLVVQTESYAGNIRLLNVDRSTGVPLYRGSIELKAEEGKLLVVNELLLEDYLCKVVPSEMPVSYGLEALKVQAICARSYAYQQIAENKCRQYGAHVDDSTTYQVYNNAGEKPESNQAVQATYGQVITYNDAVITAYYFSTSCGATTDLSIWSGSVETTPYIQGKMLTYDGYNEDLSNEEAFRNFINNKDLKTYDSAFAWYRWTIEADKKTIADTLNGRLGDYSAKNPSQVLVQREDGSFTESPVSTVGDIVSMEVFQRGSGGVIRELVVTGSKATIKIIKQGAVRALFGNSDFKIERQDGSVIDGKTLLPSAYFYLEETGDTYRFIGGGYGHGAGMSQNGVAGMTAAGKKYEEIIAYFYPGTALKTLY